MYHPTVTISRFYHCVLQITLILLFRVKSLVRDNFDNQPFDAPETARSYIDMFAAAARRSAKPHYLLTTRPGVMDRALVGVLREHGVAAVGGCREGLMAIDRLARNAK